MAKWKIAGLNNRRVFELVQGKFLLFQGKFYMNYAENLHT